MRPHDNNRPAQIPQAFKTTQPERSQMDDLQLAIMKVLVPMFTIAGWVVNLLPPLAALASILWIWFQWYHSAPMVARREKRKATK